MIETAMLEQIKIGLQVAVSKELLGASVLEDFGLSMMCDKAVLSIRGFIWGEKANSASVSYPADWWQAFRARWFPGWWLARYPVRYQTKTMTGYVVYPDFKPALPDQPRVLIWRKE